MLPGRLLAIGILLLAGCTSLHAQNPSRPLSLLFLGDNGSHQPAERFRQLAPVLKKRGITLTYTDKLTDLSPAQLSRYDGLLIYANHTRIQPDQERALLDFVASGKGFVPLHCASYCFLNSPSYIALVGAQFRSHGTGTFRSVVADVDHPILKGYQGFRSWDETYLHTKHNEKDRTVLEYRVDGDVREPWTWVRTHGKGRVFYTAWGHDQRTWGHPGFHNLVERGIRWACGQSLHSVPPYVDAPQMTQISPDAPPLKYVQAKVPFYPAGERWGVVGKPLTQMQLPLSPEDSIQHMVTPVDFEIKLFASEDLLQGKPICMNWDERGRLWVALTLDYPNELQPQGKGRDRIVLVEDRDGDGVADKVTLFADKLSIPTSITFSNGSLLVHQAPHTLFLKDTDGDGVADVRQVLFTGWSTRDTHAGPSNLRYGLDNWFYGIVGYSGFSGTIGGERHSFKQGFYRFKPDGSKLEFLRSTNNNSWGVGFSEEGLLFGSTANGNPSMYLPIPNRFYESVRGWSSTVLGGIAGNAPMHPITTKVRQVDWHGHFTAAAGHALYTARTYPREYWNRTAFVTEPTGHLVATFELQPEGTDFRSRNAWNLLASDEEWCSPIMAEVGPDGHVWVLDWYNFIVQHNPTPAGYKTGKGGAYETDLRDKKHGRIYRIVYKKAPKNPPVDLANASSLDLVATLQHPNMFWRLHAQRLLVERGEKTSRLVEALTKLVRDPKVDEIGLNPGAIHALWTLQGLDLLKDSPELALKATKHPSPAVRRNAYLVLPRTAANASTIGLSDSWIDDEPHVRLAALLSLAEMPASLDVGARLASLLDRPDFLQDRWLPDALTSAASAHAHGFLLAVPKAKGPLPSKALEIIRIVAEHHARGKPADSLDSILLASAKGNPLVAEKLFAGLARGWHPSTSVTLKPQTEEALARLLPKLPADAKATTLRLLTRIGSKSMEKHLQAVQDSLLELVRNEKVDEARRGAAARELVELRPEESSVVHDLLDCITARSSPRLVTELLDALAASRASGVGATLIKQMSSWTPSARNQAIRILLSRAPTTRELLDALEAGTIKLPDLALDQKQTLASHPDEQIATRARNLLAKGGDLPNPDRQKVIDKFLPLLKQKGDPAQGKLVFKNQCAKCHQHSGEGTKIGPDLTGMATHPKEELLIHLLDPSRSVEGNFVLYTVTTVEGKVLQGMLASESKTTIELIDTEAKRTIVQRADIEQFSSSTKSLMPEGFEKQLKPQEILDLLEFLTQKGKYLPLPLDKVATIVSTRGMFYSSDAEAERLIFPDWKPKTFKDIPFHLVDPQGDKVKNVILLHGPLGTFPPKMPRSVSLPCNTPARAIHLLSGVSGWGFPFHPKGSTSLIVRLHYADGKAEDHPLKNGEHFADYIRRVDVPDSTFAFALRGQQLRYLAILPQRSESIQKIELIKGSDRTAPIVMAITVETR